MAPLNATRSSWDREQVRARQERVWLRKLREMSPEKAEAAWKAHVAEALVKSKCNFGAQSSFHADEGLPEDITAARGFLPPEVLASPVRLLYIGEVLRWRTLPAYEHVDSAAYIETPYSSTSDALWDTVCIVSWRWTQPVPPIPVEGCSPMPDEQFTRFQAALRKVPSDRRYIWIDWCCAPQYSEDPGVEVVRSKLFFQRAATLVVVPDFKPVTPRAMLRSLLRPLSASPVRKLEQQVSKSAPGSSMEATDMLSYSPRASSGSGGVLPQWSSSGSSSHTAPGSPLRDSDSEGGREGRARDAASAHSGSALQHVVVDRYSDDLSQPSTPTGQYTVLSLENSPAHSAVSGEESGQGISFPGSMFSQSEGESLRDLASQANSRRREQARQKDPLLPSSSTVHSQELRAGAAQPRSSPALDQPPDSDTQGDGANGRTRTRSRRKASSSKGGARGSQHRQSDETSAEAPPTQPSGVDDSPTSQPRPGSAARQRSSRRSPSGRQRPSRLTFEDENNRMSTELDQDETNRTSLESETVGRSPATADNSLRGQRNNTPLPTTDPQPPGVSPPIASTSSDRLDVEGEQADVLVVGQQSGDAPPPKLHSQMSMASSVGDLPDKNEALLRILSPDEEAGSKPQPENSKKVFTPEQARPRTGALRSSTDDLDSFRHQATLPERERPDSGRKQTPIAPSFDPSTLRPTVVQPASDDVSPPSTEAPSWVGKVTASVENQPGSD